MPVPKTTWPGPQGTAGRPASTLLDDHFGSDRVGDEAGLVRLVVQLVESRLVGLFATVDDFGAQGDAGDAHLAVRALLHHPFRLVLIARDDEARPPREIEEEEHVATGGTGDESLLWIDRIRIGPWHWNDVRGRRGRDIGQAVEIPAVRAAVLSLGEILAR